MSKVIISLVAILGLSVVGCFANVLSDLERLAGPVSKAKPFVETDDGFDRHADYMYYDANEVNRHYPRVKFLNTQVTLAGQEKDMLDTEVAPSVNPFAVAQKSTSPIGQSTDRWDIKQNSNGHQFFGLYSGTNDYVVNKLRAHLLRRVANDVQDLLPYLDKTDEVDEEAHEEFTSTVRSEIMNTIRSTIMSVDDDIRESMDFNDANTASATIVIVTKKYVITATVGSGRVLSYDDWNGTGRLNADPVDPKDLFGDRKNKAIACVPQVAIEKRTFKVEKDEFGMIFLVMETPMVAKNAADKDIISNIKVISRKLVRDPDVAKSNQQEMFSKSAIQALQVSATKNNFLQRLVQVTDHTLILIGLDDFAKIH